jgi:Protein of unknown function (DUF3429)
VDPILERQAMPVSAIVLSILALGPFIGCGLGALGSSAVAADHMLTGLIGWGALLLAFLGGLHWGLAMREPDGVARAAPVAVASERERHARIGLAALPPILGWVALMLPLVTPSWLPLLVLIAGYISALIIELQFSARVLFPARYMMVRWGFTFVAVAMLTTVLTLRLLGQTIVL